MTRPTTEPMPDLWAEASAQLSRSAQERSAQRAVRTGQLPMNELERQQMQQMNATDRFHFAFNRPRADDDAPKPPGG